MFIRVAETCYAADKTGHALLHTLYEQALKKGIRLQLMEKFQQILKSNSSIMPDSGHTSKVV